MPKINGERLLHDLRTLAQFGAYKTGVHRPTFSPQDMESRRWLAERFKEVGLTAHIDGVGNVFGRSAKPGPALLIGSHSESQNHAGWLDGALGVIYGLEIARAFAESEDSRHLPIETVAWSDEEAHFLPLLGSRSFIGDLEEAEMASARNHTTGESLRDALAAAGLADRPADRIAPERYRGYLEAHIEQGDRLESAGLTIGIVTSIVAIWQYNIVFEGAQNHAGTTRMAVRKDAGLAAAKLMCLIDRQFPGVAGPRSVWTTGKLELVPGAPSIIPGRAEMLFQFRDDELEPLERMDSALGDLCIRVASETGCKVTLNCIASGRPLQMDQGFQDALQAAAQVHCPGSYMHMHSGASHDAQILGRRIPAGMLFVPSIGGVSHHWSEDTREADIALGCQVLADAAERIIKNR